MPTFVVVGAARSGTTSLWHILSGHPDVFMAPEKEPRFFLDADAPESLDRYRASFRDWRGEHAVGEVSPVYMYSPAAMQRMFDVLPSARLVAILRDPVDRAYSDYWQRRGDGRERRPFAEVVAGGGSIYLRRSRYLEHLRRVCEIYPRESLRVELFEDLCHRPVEVCRDVYRHIGVAPDYVPRDLGRRANPYVRFRSQRVRALSRRLPGIVRKLVGRLNSSRSPYPPLDAELRRRLQDGFRAENAGLAEWLGRDLGAWEPARDVATRER